MNKPAPQDRSAIIRTAIAYQARGAFDEARKLLLPLQQANPQAGDVAVALSRLAFEEGDRAECLAQLERALAESRSAEVQLCRGHIAAQMWIR